MNENKAYDQGRATGITTWTYSVYNLMIMIKTSPVRYQNFVHDRKITNTVTTAAEKIQLQYNSRYLSQWVRKVGRDTVLKGKDGWVGRSLPLSCPFVSIK